MYKLRWLVPLGLLLFAATLALAGTDTGGLSATQKDFVVPPWTGMQVGMDILVNGKPVAAVYWKDKTYLPVPSVGTPYQIRVWNHGPKRVAAVVSVDGLSVISGLPA